MDLPMQKVRRAEGRGESKSGIASQKAGSLKAAGQELTMRAGRIRLAWRLILVAVLICLASLVWINQTSSLVSVGYDIERMNQQEIVLNRQLEQLQSQVAQYENLQRIQDEATSKLGMVPPKQIVYVKVPASAASANQSSTQPGQSQLPVTDWWRQLSQILPRNNDQSRQTTPVAQK